MSNFNNKSITTKGLELLSAAMAGGKLEFTRIVMGSGAYSGDIGVIESLVNQNQSLDIKSITRKGSQVVLSTTLLQVAITENFYWKEVGVYAKGSDGLEILYMYGSATDTSFISKDMLNEKMINVGVLVSNAQNITAIIDGSLIYLSRVDLEEHDNSKTAHAQLRAWVQSLFDSLKLTWDSITGKPDTFPPSDHGHNTVTTSVVGFMSASDKTKLNGIAVNANNYVHPGSGTNPHGTTKSDVGLGSVQNYGVATIAQAQVGTADNVYMTPSKTMNEIQAWYEANKNKFGGDFLGKTLQMIPCFNMGYGTASLRTYTYTNAKGGLGRISFAGQNSVPFTVIVDGVVMANEVKCTELGNLVGISDGGTTDDVNEVLIPFKNNIKLDIPASFTSAYTVRIYQTYYINE